jgi:tetratricopeptide (TPR) repeat protein
LAFQPQVAQPAPGDAAQKEGRLAQSFDFERQAQAVLLRYGEGNQFPDDPLRPGAADFERAADLFERALQTRPSLPVKELDDRLRASLNARLLFCRGRALAYNARYDEARSLLQRARQADPLLPEPYNAIGVTYLEQAQYGAAALAFRESIRIAPDWAYPRHNLALTYLEAGDNTAAEAEYRAAIRRTPQQPYLYYNLGILLQRLNRRRESEQTFVEAIKRFKQQAESYRTRATLLRAEAPAEHPEAGSEAALGQAEAETVEGNEGEAYNALGALQQAKRNDSAARKSYQKALDMNARLFAAEYNLGILALTRREYSEAVRHFESVIGTNPTFPEAGAKLDCARKGKQYRETHDHQTRRRLRKELKACSGS